MEITNTINLFDITIQVTRVSFNIHRSRILELTPMLGCEKQKTHEPLPVSYSVDSILFYFFYARCSNFTTQQWQLSCISNKHIHHSNYFVYTCR